MKFLLLLALLLASCNTKAPAEALPEAPMPATPSRVILGLRDQLPPGFNPLRDPGLLSLQDLLDRAGDGPLLVLGDSSGFLCASLARLRPEARLDCLVSDRVHRELITVRKREAALENLAVRPLETLGAGSNDGQKHWHKALWLVNSGVGESPVPVPTELATALAPGASLLVLLDKPLFDFHPDMRWAPRRVLLQMASMSPGHPILKAISAASLSAVTRCKNLGYCEPDGAFAGRLCDDLNAILSRPGFFSALETHYNLGAGYSSELLVLMGAEDAAALQWLLLEYGELLVLPEGQDLDSEQTMAIRQMNHLVLRNLLGLGMESWRYPLVRDRVQDEAALRKQLLEAGFKLGDQADLFADAKLLVFSR